MNPLIEDRALLQARLLAGLDCAAAQPEVDGGNMAAIGYCFGGLCVLDLARVGAPVKGVVSLHGLFNPPGNTEGNSISSKVLVLHGWADPMVPPDTVIGLATENGRRRARTGRFMPTAMPCTGSRMMPRRWPTASATANRRTAGRGSRC